MKYGESLIMTGAFKCLCLVYPITPAVLRYLTSSTAPRYENVIRCPVPKFVLTSLSLSFLGRLYATRGGLLNTSANRSCD